MSQQRATGAARAERCALVGGLAALGRLHHVEAARDLLAQPSLRHQHSHGAYGCGLADVVLGAQRHSAWELVPAAPFPSIQPAPEIIGNLRGEWH